MRKSLLLSLFLVAAFVSKGQTLVSESFDGSTFPPSGWTTIHTSGTSATAAVWARVTSGTFPAQSPHSGAGEAQFNSFSASNGTAELTTPSFSLSFTGGVNQLSFWMYRDNGYATTADKIDVYINTSATASGGTLLGTVNRAIGLTPTVSTTGWYQYTFTVPATFTSTTNYIVFNATSLYGNDIFLDDVNIVHLTPCNGTPTAGTAVATPNPVCPNVPFTLSAPSASVGSGLSYQWQSSPAGANTWTNITAGTTLNYTVAAGITTATDYRLIVTCTAATTTTATTTLVAVTLNSFISCYCNSAATSTADDDIGQFTVNSFANPATAPTPILNNTTAVNLYTNFTSLGPISMIINQASSFTLTQIEGFGTFYTCYLKIFLDIDHDGQFTSAGETLYSGTGPASSASPTLSGTLTVPATALTGLTRMRVVLVESGSATSVTPCGTYTWGETEDYTVNLLSATPPPPLITTNSPICPGSTLIVTVTPSTTGYANPTFTLTGPFATSPAVSVTGVFNITGTTAANGGTYTATMTSGGFTSANSANATVVINPTPSLVVSNIVTPTSCTTANGSFQLNNLAPSTNYTLFYRKNNAQQTPISITSTAAGTYVFNNLAAATYDSIRTQNPAPTNCLSLPVSAIVPSPTAPPTPTATYTPVCPNKTLTLSVTSATVPGGTYDWTGPTYTATGAIVTRPNMSAAFNGAYNVTLTVAGCVSSPYTVNVTMTPADPPPIPNNVVYCQFEVALPLSAQGQNLEWWSSPTSTIPISTGAGPTPSTLVATGTPPIIYYVSQNAVCVSPRVPITVTVKPKPAPPTIPQPIYQVCQFEPIGALSASGASIRWFATPTGGVGSATAPTPNTLVSGTFYYYASQTVNGCESDRAITTVIVKPKPKPPVVTSPLQLCQGDIIGPVSALGQNLLWYPLPVGGIGVPVAPVPTTGYEDSFKYFVSQTINGCESDRALMAVYVNYRPNGIITGSSPWVCMDENDTFKYYGNARPDAQYAWYAPPGTHIVAGGTTQGPFIVHFDSAGVRVIRLTINNKGCISDLISAPITVRPLPIISYVNRQDVCEHDLVNVALNSQTGNINAFHFTWGSDDAIVEYTAGPGGPFGIRYPKAGHYQISVTATSNLCTSKPLIQDIYVHQLPDATIHPGKSPKDICASDTLYLMVTPVAEGAVYTWTPAAYFQGHKDTLNNEVFAVVSQTSEVKVHIKTAFGCEANDSLMVTTKSCCGVYFPNAFAPTGNVIQNRVFRPITTGVHRVNSFRVVNRWGQVMYESKVEREGWNGLYNGVPQDMGTYYYYINYRCEAKDVEERGEFILIR